jgi:hypothetical protein
MTRHKALGAITLAIVLATNVMAPQIAGAQSAPLAIVSDQAGQPLDWLHSDGTHLVDQSGRDVILRGFVTITNYNDGSALNYTADDYARMKALGADYQSIRIGACSIGAWPGCQASDAYLQQLDSMVQTAKAAGMYSEFKLTTYDIPGQAPANWTALWQNSGGQQDAIINGWKNLWQRYASEPAVLGYDLLNEPELGNLKMQDPQFVQQYLNPFYERIIDAFRQIDTQHVAIFQPVIGSPPYDANVSRDNVVFAPHFYPQVKQYLQTHDATTNNYPQLVQQLNGQAQNNHAPLLMGEYGMPYNPDWDNQPSQQSRYQAIELAEAAAFDALQLSSSRPWWSDDKAGIYTNGQALNWAVLQGRDGLSDPERHVITDVFARPYPARTAGTLTNFSFDFGSHTFKAQYTPSGTGTTVFVVPRQRAFGGNFVVTHSGGVTANFDPSTNALDLTTNTPGIDPSAFSWDEASGTLSIADWATDPVTLTITPQ